MLAMSKERFGVVFTESVVLRGDIGRGSFFGVARVGVAREGFSILSFRDEKSMLRGRRLYRFCGVAG